MERDPRAKMSGLRRGFVKIFCRPATGVVIGGVVVAVLVIGLALEFLVFRHLYARDHLDQVLATFGLILLLNQGVKMLWGAAPLSVPVPAFLSGHVALLDGILYPTYRFALIGAGLAVGALLWFVVEKTRTGMLLRAGASNAPMVSALGVDINRLFMIVFAFGTMLAAFAGVMAAPILSVEPGMGDNILILAFVVIVVGGIGSIRGAFVAALIPMTLHQGQPFMAAFATGLVANALILGVVMALRGAALRVIRG